jgi:hypothetical protein
VQHDLIALPVGFLTLSFKFQQDVFRLKAVPQVFYHAREILPWHALVQSANDFEKLFGIKVKHLGQVLISGDEVDNVVNMNFVLRWSEVAVRELFSIEEHLNYPQKFVADVAARLFYLVLLLRV